MLYIQNRYSYYIQNIYMEYRIYSKCIFISILQGNPATSSKQTVVQSLKTLVFGDPEANLTFEMLPIERMITCKMDVTLGQSALWILSSEALSSLIISVNFTQQKINLISSETDVFLFHTCHRFSMLELSFRLPVRLCLLFSQLCGLSPSEL